MKKNRNSFFAESNAIFQDYNPMIANTPYQNATSNGSYYPGPIVPNIMNNPSYNEISERLAKIERQINRLDYRINKLESGTVVSTDDYESTTNNMYII